MPNPSDPTAPVDQRQELLHSIPEQRNRRAPAQGRVGVSSSSPGWFRRIASPTVLVLLGVLLLFALETVAIIAACGWHFYYSLDDPYIHLAVSDQIRHLGYGINPGEAETPSSSVLWPFLLAGTAGTPLHEATPIALTLVATMLSALLLLRLARLVVSRERKWLTVLSILTVMLCLNWIGVAFTGLEHSAHIAAALAVGVGLVECARRRTPPWWLYAGIILNPLLRYEGIAITVGAALVLAWYGHRRAAALCVTAAAVPLVVFSVVAVRNGLSPLPSSVLVKSGVATGGGVFQSANLLLRTVQPLFVLLVAGLLIHLALVGRRRVTPLHLYALWVVAAHCVAGKFGWLGRYELYVYAAVLPVVVHLAAPVVAAACRQHPPRRLIAAMAVLVAVCFPYVQVTALTPIASRNVYLQQAQMARFAADYWPGPVAVNDVGLVSYEDKGRYVLDLWGLANQEAREARTADHSDNSAEWMDRLAVEHGVTSAMIYTEPRWFPTIPRDWQPVARMWFSGPQVSADGEQVTFFATSKREAPALRAALRDFQRRLPSGAHLAFDASQSP